MSRREPGKPTHPGWVLYRENGSTLSKLIMTDSHWQTDMTQSYVCVRVAVGECV